jgi:hypothetical protein
LGSENQQKCVIERKCNNDLHITSYVLRTPKLQPSMRDTIGTRTRQEKLLQEGLQKGWIPFLIKSVVSKIIYDKSKINSNHKSFQCFIRGTSAPYGESNGGTGSGASFGPSYEALKRLMITINFRFIIYNFTNDRLN